MIIEVTKDDVRLGLKTTSSNTKCPVARAMRRAGFRDIKVGISWIRTSKGESTLPRKATCRIETMCSRDTMKPFTFILSEKKVRQLKGLN